MEKQKEINSNPSFEEKSGEVQKMNSAIRQQLSSFADEQWLAEQWLINTSGVLPDSSIDTLLMYAYAQKGVLHDGVTLEINRDDANQGANPSVTYKIKLEPAAMLGWQAIKKAEQIKKPILKKLALLGLAKTGAPYAIDEAIKTLAKNYLPKKYHVEVHIIE